ncbi:hypothetical protein J7J62_03930 [bacterium]|nr:hypothetical protein [bacterium]
MKDIFEIFKLNPKTINSFKQNKPKYIAKDFENLFGIDKRLTYMILLGRGIFKWLAIRENLIKLKNEWKKEITELNNQLQKLPKNSKERKILAERWKTLVRCREQVRKLCHSTRWQAPSNDKEAVKFLEHITKNKGLDIEVKNDY